ncbi:hypothetical protein [Skermanella stibiiresistens]|nr:hypothetical protein [Skermanella stibiiresistens]
MAIEMVNGYVCRDCADVEKAKKGIDPGVQPDADAGRAKTSILAPGPAKDANQPLGSGTIGTVLNILV